jgi:cephalosporin hydroxylase
MSSSDDKWKKASEDWFLESAHQRYTYRWSWLGVQLIQYPSDVMALQELVWRIQPDCVVETGVAHGGSVIFYASMLELLGGDREVVGIDVDIRPHNRKVIEEHRLYPRVHLIQGSSIDPKIVEAVHERVRDRKRIMVVLDSNHTHEHVLAELNAYSDLVKADSYLVVLDTGVENLPPDFFKDRPWGPGNNPMTAVREFLKTNPRFTIDSELEERITITVAPSGYLRCTADA